MQLNISFRVYILSTIQYCFFFSLFFVVVVVSVFVVLLFLCLAFWVIFYFVVVYFCGEGVNSHYGSLSVVLHT